MQGKSMHREQDGNNNKPPTATKNQDSSREDQAEN
jgi:hypothetical protein